MACKMDRHHTWHRVSFDFALLALSEEIDKIHKRGWFDISFIPPPSPSASAASDSLAAATEESSFTLSTSPAHERTHWQHCRFLLNEPLAVNVNDEIRGTFKAVANAHRSYDITMELTCGNQRRTGSWPLHQQTDYYGTTGTYVNNEFRPEWIGQYNNNAPSS